jgi:hypothetical protein
MATAALANAIVITGDPDRLRPTVYAFPGVVVLST